MDIWTVVYKNLLRDPLVYLWIDLYHFPSN